MPPSMVVGMHLPCAGRQACCLFAQLALPSKAPQVGRELTEKVAAGVARVAGDAGILRFMQVTRAGLTRPPAPPCSTEAAHWQGRCERSAPRIKAQLCTHT